MEEIAECAELSKATLYLYFKNKEEIILQIMNAVITKFIEYLEERMSKVDSAQDKIKMIGETYLDFYSECHGQFLLLSAQESTAGMVFSNLNGYQEYLSHHSKFWTIICAPISTAVEEGYFRKDSNTVEIAITLWSASKGLMHIMDNVVSTINCGEYQKLTEKNGFQEQLDTLDYIKMLRNLWDAIIISYQNKTERGCK
jgi:TetR/AcrR family transcriptional regulator